MLRVGIIIVAVALFAGVVRGEDVVLPLTVDSGEITDRDTRSFAVPLTINGVEAKFTWACGGWTIVSETLARECKLTIRPDADLESFVDSAGRPMFLGSSIATIELAGVKSEVDVVVMRDGVQPGLVGVVGFDVAKKFQWEIDPSVPSLTLRKPKTKIQRKPLATLPLTLDQMNLWLNVKIRGVAVDVMLLPQSTDVQIAPDLQKKWDMTLRSGREEPVPQSYIGDARSLQLRGDDGVWLAKNVFEKNVLVILMADHPNAQSGLGQSLLNRFVYCVDPEKKEFTILRRATTQKSD